MDTVFTKEDFILGSGKVNWEKINNELYYKRKYSTREIGKILGLTHHQVKYYLNKNGYKYTPEVPIEFVKEQFAKEGYKVISKRVRRAKQEVWYICPNGHKHKTSWHNWTVRGIRCGKCYKESNPGKSKKEWEVFKQELESQKYKMISPKPKRHNDSIIFKIECPEGHITSTTYSSWLKHGRICERCLGINNYTREGAEKIINEEGYRLITIYYRGVTQKLTVKCKEGHQFTATLLDFLDGKVNCPICRDIRSSKVREAKESLEKKVKKIEGMHRPRKSSGGSFTISKARRMEEVWKDRDTFLYFIQLEGGGEKFYKVGITAFPKVRFKAFPYKIKPIRLIKTNLYAATFAEQFILKRNIKYRYRPKKDFGGSTECFTTLKFINI